MESSWWRERLYRMPVLLKNFKIVNFQGNLFLKLGVLRRRRRDLRCSAFPLLSLSLRWIIQPKCLGNHCFNAYDLSRRPESFSIDLKDQQCSQKLDRENTEIPKTEPERLRAKNLHRRVPESSWQKASLARYKRADKIDWGIERGK